MIKVKSKVFREEKPTEEENPQTLNKWSVFGTMQELKENFYRHLVEGFTPSFTLGKDTEERVTKGKDGAFTPQF